MLEYGGVNGVKYLAAGRGERTDWVRNLIADPRVSFQTHHGMFAAAARRVTEPDELRLSMAPVFQDGGDAYFRPWLASLGMDCNIIEEFIAKRERTGVIALDTVGGPPLLPSLEADLRRVRAVVGASFLLGWPAGRRR
jgi:hypothetical protein